MNNTGHLLAAKAQIRRELRQRRDALGAEQRAAAGAVIKLRLYELSVLRQAQVVFCFISAGPEVSTHAVMDGLLAQRKTVLVPKISPGQPMRAVVFPGWDNLVAGPLGIPAPATDEAFSGPVDLVITPGLGFTPAGDRIGYGRAYYDRWFATHDHRLRAGVAFECQLVESLPTGDTDVPMHIVLTELRTIEMAGG